MTDRSGVVGHRPPDIGAGPGPTATERVDQAASVARFEAALARTPMGAAGGGEVAKVLSSAVSVQSHAWDATHDVVKEGDGIPRNEVADPSHQEIPTFLSPQPVTGAGPLVGSPCPVRSSKEVRLRPERRASVGEQFMFSPSSGAEIKTDLSVRILRSTSIPARTKGPLEPALDWLVPERSAPEPTPLPAPLPATDAPKLVRMAADVPIKPEAERVDRVGMSDPVANSKNDRGIPLPSAGPAPIHPEFPQGQIDGWVKPPFDSAFVPARPPEPLAARIQTVLHTPGPAPSRIESKSDSPLLVTSVRVPASVPLPVSQPTPTPATHAPKVVRRAGERPEQPEVGLSDHVPVSDPVASAKTDWGMPVPSAWLASTRSEFLQGQIKEPSSSSVRFLSALGDLIEATVARLDSSSSALGATQVRLEFKAEFLPGVTAVLQQANGRIQVDFFCVAEASRQLLSAISRREVGDVARRCRRDLLFRIHAHDEDRIESASVLEIMGSA